MNKLTTKNIIDKAKRLEGKTLREVLQLEKSGDSENIMKNKSNFARFIERDYFNLPLNSDSKADFREVGINLELKTSGFKYMEKSNLFNAKERITLTQIDYNDTIKKENWFDNSHLKKVNNILFIVYLYEKDISTIDRKILHTFIWTPNDYQSKLMQHDYSSMRMNIIDGKHLSGGNHSFMGNCPRHNSKHNKKNLSLSEKGSIDERHPFLDYAERRAFELKSKVFTEIVAESLKVQIKRKGRSAGLKKEDFPNF